MDMVYKIHRFIAIAELLRYCRQNFRLVEVSRSKHLNLVPDQLHELVSLLLSKALTKTLARRALLRPFAPALDCAHPCAALRCAGLPYQVPFLLLDKSNAGETSYCSLDMHNARK